MSLNNCIQDIPVEIENLGGAFTALWHELPMLMTRKEFCKKIPYSPRTLANLDSLGVGPAKRVKIGKKVCYSKPEALLWLASRSKSVS